MQHAAAGDLERVAAELLDPQRNVALGFGEQPFAQVAAGNIFAVLTEQRRVVDSKQHTDGRLVHRDHRHLFGMFGIGNGIGNIDVGDADDAAEVAAFNAVGFLAADAFESEKLLDRRRLYTAVTLDDGERFAELKIAAVNAADTDAADIIGIVERCHLSENRAFNPRRSRNVFENRVHQRQN